MTDQTVEAGVGSSEASLRNFADDLSRPVFLVGHEGYVESWTIRHFDAMDLPDPLELPLVEHLVQLGRKNLVHIAGPDGNMDAQERSDAFEETCAKHGIRCESVPGDFTEESGAAAIETLLNDGQGFDGIFAANDNMAIGALGALRSAGLRVPQDVAVAGFDDIPLAKHLGLTTVRVRIAELGERAIVRLLDIIGQEDGGGDELHAPQLIARASTDQGHI